MKAYIYHGSGKRISKDVSVHALEPQTSTEVANVAHSLLGLTKVRYSDLNHTDYGIRMGNVR